MNAKGPEDVFDRADASQFGTALGEGVDFSEFAIIQVLFDERDGGLVHEEVSHHENPVGFFRDPDEIFRFTDIEGEWLLDEGVDA